MTISKFNYVFCMKQSFTFLFNNLAKKKNFTVVENHDSKEIDRKKF